VSKRFVSNPYLKPLTENSLEYIISEVRRAVDSFFIEPRNIEILASFPDHAVVRYYAPTGRYVKVHLKENKTGVLEVVRTESIDVPAADARDVARELVDHFLKGNRSAVEEGMKNLCGIVGSIRTSKEVIEDTIVGIKAVRPWKRVLETKATKVFKLVGEPQNKTFEPKFAKLRDGTIVESDLHIYGDLVKTDLRLACQRMNSVQEKLAESRVVLDTAGSVIPSASVISNFNYFVEDLERDVEVCCKSLSDVRSLADTGHAGIRNLAEVCDTLTRALPMFETASMFVQNVASTLEASRS